MKNLIVRLRKSAKLTQKKLAQQLDMSRPTLRAIEKGERDVTLTELKRISEIFDIPISIILDEEMGIEDKMKSKNFSEKSLKKFHNLMLQCIKYGADSDGKITKTKLAKLIYLCDFAYYYKFLVPISGFDYYRLAKGPVAIEFFDIIDADESIYTENKGKAIMVSLVEEPDSSILEPGEKKLIKEVCAKWKNTNTQEIVDFTHRQIPWKICKEREVIPYCLINNEDPENVY